ncbi:hydrolase [Pararobbsia silviterrae]|uniref:Hydrolase n=1 Tax=Pararobbsia silviterrae TaxID=1792498 RepID=A0A494YBA2_9BURK|nr:hydrolase [Pararobbsia silviterrae]RKP59030.1 hydrolase [Pararobbsia silviterrae]
MQSLDPRTTALVLIDLQQGILPFAKGPRTGDAVLETSARLAKRFRERGALVVLVRVGWHDDFADSLALPADQPTRLAPGMLPANWLDFPDALEAGDKDLYITKRQWGAFHGTELDLQLRRRGIRTIVLGGISTNIGVESTSRVAYELGYEQVLVEDAMSAGATEHHDASVKFIFPRVGFVRQADEVLAALGE